MTDFPIRGQQRPGYWDLQLKAWIEEQIEDAALAADGGMELGYSSRTSSFTTTNTNGASAAGDIPSFGMSVIGTGRPVDLRATLAAVYHSVASTFVSAAFVIDGNALSSNGQLAGRQSTLTNNGPGLEFTRRTAPLVEGQAYNIGLRIWGAVAGTSTVVAAAYCPIELSAVGR